MHEPKDRYIRIRRKTFYQMLIFMAMLFVFTINQLQSDRPSTAILTVVATAIAAILTMVVSNTVIPAAAPLRETILFDIILKDAGGRKIEVIKVLRLIMPAFGLKEIKDVVESTPQVIRVAVPKEDAERIKAMLAEVGATVELQ
ncbi:MAG: ribosomal protein L7/L12 [Oscillospiraceae bacterium]|nr:ribosomal protein L7/L12 [Oscillospiraceae bacterium]